jgi:hypothetical protein
LVFASQVTAGTHSEFLWPDAGDLPDNAQWTVCYERLDAIVGSIESPSDTDMFALWIRNPDEFSVSTVKSAGDTQLYLFNDTGIGVLSNVIVHGLGNSDGGACFEKWAITASVK